MKYPEFTEQVDKLQDQVRTASNLEEFLRAMWDSILKHKDSKPTWELFLQIISQAWANKPLDFDELWLSIDKSSDSVESKSGTQLDDFDYLKGTILYQIADLRRMRDAGYYEKDPIELFFGVQSPTGASWYNWSPEGFLDGAMSGLTSHYSNENSGIQVSDDVTWRDLGELLYLGQLYE